MVKQKRKMMIIGGVVCAVIVLGLVWGYQTFFNQKSDQSTEYRVKSEDIVDDDRFTGVIESQNRQEVIATSSQQIADIYVSEGEQVPVNKDLYITTTGEVIRSTIAGEVSKVYYEKDNTVSVGGKIMEIVDYSNLQINLKVEENQLSDIEVNTSAEINIDSIDRSINGIVSEISREATNEKGVAYFTAKVNFTGDADIRIGMNAEVIIVEESEEDVLTVPVDAIQFTGDDKTYVNIENDDGKVASRMVTTGITDGVKIEITEGLNEGDIVLIPEIIYETTTFSGPQQTVTSNV